jgi:hypothetical protein
MLQHLQIDDGRRTVREGRESEVVVGSGKPTAPHSNKPEDIRHSTFWNMASSNGHGLEGRFTAIIELVSSPKSYLSCLQLCPFSIELLLLTQTRID